MPKPWDTDEAADIVRRHGGHDGAVLALLDALEAAFGPIPDTAIAQLAAAVGVDGFEMRGLVLFHRDVAERDEPRRVVRVCRGERCRARGGAALGEAIAARLGVDWYGTTADGRVRFEPIYCQGLCDHGPTAQVDGIPFPRLDKVGAAAIVALVGAGGTRRG